MGETDTRARIGPSHVEGTAADAPRESGDLRAPSEDLPGARSAPRSALARLLRLRADPRLPQIATSAQTLRRDALYRRSLAVADILAAAAALVLTIIVLGGDSVKPWLIAAVPLVVVVGKVIGLYDRDEHLIGKTTLEEAPALFQVSTLYTLLIWLGQSALVKESAAPSQTGALGRAQVLGLWTSLFVCMLVARATAREVVSRGTSPERCLLLGDGQAARHVGRKFDSAASVGAIIVGRVPLEGESRSGGETSVLGQLSELESLITDHRVERVIIAPTTADSDQLLDSIRLVKALGVKVSVLPRLFEVVGSSVRFDDVEGLMLLGVPHWGLSKSSRLVKRAFDLIGVSLGLLVVAPLLATIALAVKLTSPGRVLFRQPRIGQNGEQFQMVKFRTMHEDADERKADLLALNEADGLFKIANDPRLTRAGRLLRRFSFDELPQLFNVLKGDMSLVGPRPLVTDDDERVEGWHRRRLDVPPGMTGTWQVLGSARVPLDEMVKIDYLYGANWSLWLDIKILLRTVPHVLGRRGL